MSEETALLARTCMYVYVSDVVAQHTHRAVQAAMLGYQRGDQTLFT